VVISICELAGRALRHIADTEGDHLAGLGGKMRNCKEVSHDEA